MLKSTLAYFLSTVILNQERKETKDQTECPNKDINTRSKRSKLQLEADKKQINYLSNNQLTEGQINLLAKGLKFIPTPLTN